LKKPAGRFFKKPEKPDVLLKKPKNLQVFSGLNLPSKKLVDK